jgi:predicted GIY-YIG superfamily endonuclease
MSATNIYILRLEGNRYYIGKSDNVQYRIQQHFNGSVYASAWTKKYKPIAIEKIIQNTSPFDEDKYTKEYMSKYTIDKVRGGSYVEIELSDFQKETLHREIWGVKDLCKQCGRSGHFVKDCYAKTDIFKNKIKYEESVEDDSDESDDINEYEYQCNYCDRTFTTGFGCGIHEKSCKDKKTKARNVKQVPGKKESVCYRCGNTGHYSPDCYATKHAKGYYLD